MDKIILGSDPELFVETGGGELIPAFEFLGSKESPNETPKGQKVYWDGFQAEFTVKESSNIDEVLDSIKCGLSTVLELAKIKDPLARLSSKTVTNISMDLLRDLPTEFTEFGCMPSFNAYEIAGRGEEGNTVPYRFSGGHIHFGIGRESDNLIPNIMRNLDSILGVACVSLFENLDNPIRREYYGLPGEYRTPPWGLEYRTLSNAWMFHPEIASIVLSLSRKVLSYALSGGSDWQTNDGEVIETVVLSDVDKAREILKRNRKLLDIISPGAYNLFSIPVEETVSGIKNIEANWGI